MLGSLSKNPDLKTMRLKFNGVSVVDFDAIGSIKQVIKKAEDKGIVVELIWISEKDSKKEVRIMALECETDLWDKFEKF